MVLYGVNLALYALDVFFLFFYLSVEDGQVVQPFLDALAGGLELLLAFLDFFLELGALVAQLAYFAVGLRGKGQGKAARKEQEEYLLFHCLVVVAFLESVSEFIQQAVDIHLSVFGGYIGVGFPTSIVIEAAQG